MRIEVNRSEGTEAFYRECANVAFQYRKLMKKPGRKLMDYFKTYKIMMVLCVVLIVLMLALQVLAGFDAFGLFISAMLVVVCVADVKTYRTMEKYYQNMVDDTRPSVFIVDEQGVAITKGTDMAMHMGWNNVAFARVFKEAMCFFSKDATTMMLALNRKRVPEVLEYIKAEGIDVRIVE